MELIEYIGMLSEIGFMNEKSRLRLFEMDRERSLFELSELNMNYEPLVMTNLALRSIQSLLEKAKPEWITDVAKYLTTKLMEMMKIGKKDAILQKQSILLSDFIAAL